MARPVTTLDDLTEEQFLNVVAVEQAAARLDAARASVAEALDVLRQSVTKAKDSEVTIPLLMEASGGLSKSRILGLIEEARR